MRAAQLVGPRQIEIVDANLPGVGPEEVRVQLTGCGVCSSNVPPFEGREWFSYPMEPGALGHEGWGTVEAVGARVTDVRPGDSVAFIGQHSYAEYDVVTRTGIVKLPPEVAGLPFPGEPLGCAMNIYARSGIRPGDTVVIVGIGFLGAVLTWLAARDGAHVIAVARRSEAKDLALSLGAEVALSPEPAWEAVDAVKERTGDEMADVVIEAVGKEDPLNLAAELTRIRGRLIVAGYHQDGMRSVNMQLWNWRGLDVINAHERDPEIYTEGIRNAVLTLAEGLPLHKLITHRYRFEDLGQALTDTIEHPSGFLKGVVTFR